MPKRGLTGALACMIFLVALIAGGGLAGAQVSVPLPACANGVDDDGGGDIDLADPDCLSSAGTSEGAPPAPPEPQRAKPPAPAKPPVRKAAEPPRPPSNQSPASPAKPPVPVVPPGGSTGGGGSEDGSDGGGGGGAGGGGGGAEDPAGGVGGAVPGDPLEGLPGSGGAATGGSGKGSAGTGGAQAPIKPPPPFKADGTPTISNPSTTVALFGPAPVGVPNFVIDSFEIPPFLLPIYQACGTQYAIPWPILASINKIETAFGTNLNVSYAGAVGWMQFMPATWAAYGVDANADGIEDPYNPVDAICAAARYLRASGGTENLYNAIFAYNHADWYVDEVLLYARAYGKLPDDLVSSLTGLTEGAHFPVAADARYADDIATRQAIRESRPGQAYGNAAKVIESSPTRRGINIFSRKGAPIVAVNDGVIKKIGRSRKLGRFIVLQDAYGNRFTYAELGEVSDVHPVPKPRKLTAADFELVTPASDEEADREPDEKETEKIAERVARDASTPERTSGDAVRRRGGPVNTEDMRPRLYALPNRPGIRDRASLTGQLDQLAGRKVIGYETFKNYFNDVFAFDRKSTELRPLRVGSRVIAGTVLGRMAGRQDGIAPHIHFTIRPSGRGAPRIDPKPILDGWKLLEATAIYRAAGKDPFSDSVGIGAILLMSKEQLIRRVLSDPRLEIYSCGRTDIRTGQINRRILALLEYLAAKGFELTVTSLKCGHSYLTASGNVSNHSSGNAVDIAAINAIPVLGNQGPGTLTEALVKTVLALQGTMESDELISLMDFGGPSFAMSDHADHVHVGYSPEYGDRVGREFVQLLKPDQWKRLIDRLGEIENPEVPVGPSRFSLKAEGKGGKDGKPSGPKRASDAHRGE